MSSNGELLVRVQTPVSIADDSSVQLTNVANGEVLAYNGTASRWENKEVVSLGLNVALSNIQNDQYLAYDNGVWRNRVLNAVTTTQITNWDNTYNTVSTTSGNWNSAFSWGNHQAVGYIVGLANDTVTDGNIAAFNGTTGKLLKDTGVAISSLASTGYVDNSISNITIANVSATAPVNASQGDLWFNSAIGDLSVYYNDGDSSQWVSTAVSLANYATISYVDNQVSNKDNWNSAFSHISLTNNPHATTKAQVGLTNVIDALQATTATFNATITSGSWTGSDPFTKAITVTGITATDNPIIDLELSGVTFANVPTVQTAWGKIYRGVTTANTITFYATEALTVDIPFSAKVVR
jgi:hypothetical protein